MLRLKSTTISNIHFLVLGWSNWRVFLSGAAVNQIKNWWNLLGLICFIEMRYIARRSQLDILFVATSTTPCPLLINGPQEVLGKHRRMYRITIKQPTARLTLRFHCSSHLLPLPVPANHRYLIALLGCRTPPSCFPADLYFLQLIRSERQMFQSLVSPRPPSPAWISRHSFGSDRRQCMQQPTELLSCVTSN